MSYALYGSNYHYLQSLVVGDVTCVKDLTLDHIAKFLCICKETMEFVDKVYLPDLLAIASFCKDWGGT